MRHLLLGSTLLPVMALAITAPLSAQSGTSGASGPGGTGGASAQGDVALTIYTNGQALVQDIRSLPVTAGRSTIAFPDVSAQIRPETLSFNAADTAIVEQNFDFDLLTPQKLMEKAVGQTITLIRTNPATGVEVQERAKVLSTEGGTVVQIGDRIEVLRDDGLPVRAVFDQVPSNLRSRPTLSVTVDSSRAGTRPVSLRYLTAGLNWSADYVALFDETKSALDMQGWITLQNNSGTTFEQANTVLVAGNPAGSDEYRPLPRRGAVGGNMMPGTETADRERLGDFYLYPLAGRTTVATNQTKQVNFLDVQAVAASRIYARRVEGFANDTAPVNVDSRISFSTRAAGGLGDALPAGTVRFYQRDRTGAPQFVGENTIGHTPMGSTLQLTTGSAFDVSVQAEVAKRSVIAADEYERSSRYRVTVPGKPAQEFTVERGVDYFRTEMRYTFRNALARPVEVELLQSGLDRGGYAGDVRVTQEDVPGEQLNLNQRQYRVTVPANGERVVRVTYETRY